MRLKKINVPQIVGATGAGEHHYVLTRKSNFKLQIIGVASVTTPEMVEYYIISRPCRRRSARRYYLKIFRFAYDLPL